MANTYDRRDCPPVFAESDLFLPLDPKDSLSLFNDKQLPDYVPPPIPTNITLFDSAGSSRQSFPEVAMTGVEAISVIQEESDNEEQLSLAKKKRNWASYPTNVGHM